MNDIIVRTINMPYAVKAYTQIDSNNDYNVYLNARYCCSEQLKSYYHELKHILCGDFEKPEMAHIIETRA